MARKLPKLTAPIKGELMRKVRKPIAPPAKVEEDQRKYQRARERARQRRHGQN
jgi:hypothetical protein